MKFIIIITLLISNAWSNTKSNQIKEYKKMVNFVANAIHVVRKISTPRRKLLAREITKNSIKYNIDPRLMVAIINTESHFKKDAYNPSGDYSLVQINYNIWKKEFKNRNLRPLDKNKLVNDESYAIDRMAEILSILKREHSHKEKLWYLRYHSKTEKYQKLYLSKLKGEIKKIINIPHYNLF